MESENQTLVTEFLILGLTDDPQLQPVLFLLFLVIYFLTVLGNVTIVVVTCLDSRLRTPMYFFLSNLSFLDVCYTSVTVPRMLLNLLSQFKTISYSACISQLYFFIVFAGTECFLLTAMAYDRYLAVCKPLRYPVLMDNRRLLLLAAAAWGTGIFNATSHISFTVRLVFCGPNEIDHFFCDIRELLKLACSSTRDNQLEIFLVGGTLRITSFCLTLGSYILIIITILKIHSAESRRKTFSTCASHLTVVVLYYGTLNFVYGRQTTGNALDVSKTMSVMFSVVIPMLNPLIYTLRNQQVKGAIGNFWTTRCCLLKPPLSAG
ncbi:olfactory receptor 1009-like [Tachyglossus aculeatus]|uniref:olfactory receptor 1009-like n=1 Tax=Tachyglossus aculeatus TaxID=9261 RepID=UPI0018F48491|nr:olfactory receptor 1009-like [Tachyglossus aculeatus]